MIRNSKLSPVLRESNKDISNTFKDNEVVEYALSRSLSPTMISEYKTQLPNKKLLQQKLHELFDEKSNNI
jgi:hypothetical protein